MHQFTSYAENRKGYHQPATRRFMCRSGAHKAPILATLLDEIHSYAPAASRPRLLSLRSRYLNASQKEGRSYCCRLGQPIRVARSIFLTTTVKESRCGLVQQFTILVLHDRTRFRLGLACERRKGTRDEKEDR
jgi:hypothetical protein